MPPRKRVKPPAEYREDVAALPPVLRKLLLAELAAGNTIAEVGHSFPAPPFGAYFKLSAPVTTQAHASCGGLGSSRLNPCLNKRLRIIWEKLIGKVLSGNGIPHHTRDQCLIVRRGIKHCLYTVLLYLPDIQA